MKELLEILKTRATYPGLPYALATVVRVEGSSYRKPGARMLIGARGRLAGSVSGGCLEKDVIRRGLAVILSRQPQVACYDTGDHDDLAFGASLGCQGRIEIFIEPVAPDRPWPLAEAAKLLGRQRRAGGLALVYRGPDAGTLVLRVGEERHVWPAGTKLPRGLEDDLEQAIGTKKSRAQAYEISGRRLEVLLERIAPPLRLILCGGGHDVPPLVRLAKELGHQVTVVDRRAEFAEVARFPGADRVVQARPVEIPSRLELAEDDAVVIMNHHYETDAELLGRLLARPLFYLGMLGPRKRTARVLEELRQAGTVFNAAQMEKLHAPAGLDLGSENPEHIALSILAEIQAVQAGRTGAQLRDRAAAERTGGAKSSL